MAWFRKELEDSDSKNLKTLIFCHFPLLGDPRFNLWNSEEVLNLIENSESVKVWMNGHFHEGGYALKNEIHHINMKGMVQFKAVTFSVAHLNGNELSIEGYGAEESRILKI